MSHSRWLALAACFPLAFLALTADRAGGDDSVKKTTLKVMVPQKRSQVLVDGKEVVSKASDVREFTAPALKKDHKEYEVAVRWRTNNYTRFTRTRKVAAKPGETVVVDLRESDPKNPDHIDIRWVPTPNDVVKEMCKMGKVGKEDVVYDLGCGDGRMVLIAVEDFKAKRGVGIDIDPKLVATCKEAAKEKKLTDKVEFREGDVLKVKDISDATVVLLYMGDDVNERLKPILQKTLKPGSRVVSHRFTMGDWKPDETKTFAAEDGDEYLLHVWTIK